MLNEALEKVIHDNFDSLKRKLNITDWAITVNIGKLADGQAGNCAMQWRYKKATITLDNYEIKDEEEALNVLRHEMIHVMLSDFNNFACAFENEIDMPHSIYMHMVDACQERLVESVERLLDG